MEDDNHGKNASARLARVSPWKPVVHGEGGVESPFGKAGFQTYTSDPINMTVWPSQRLRVGVYINGDFVWVYGVTVEYHVNK